MPKYPPLRKSINQAHFDNGTYKKMVSHLEWDLELNGLQAPDELQINTVTQQAAHQNPEKPRPTCHHCKQPSQYWHRCRQFKREKDPAQNIKNNVGNNINNNGGQINSTSNNQNPNNTNENNTIIRKHRRPRPVYPPCEACGKTNHSTEKCCFGAKTANRSSSWNSQPERQIQAQQRDNQIAQNDSTQAAAQNLNKKRHVFTPERHLTDGRPLKLQNFHQFPRLSGRNPRRHLYIKTTWIIFLLIVRYRQSYKLRGTQGSDVASRTSPPKEIQPQNHVIAMKQPQGNQRWNGPVPFFICSNSCPTEIQESEKRILTTFKGDTTVLPLTITTSLIEERLVRDEQTNDLYITLTSTVVLKRKQEMLYVPLDFNDCLTVEALIDSRAYVSAIALNELDTKKNRKPRVSFSKSTTFPLFKYK